MRIVKRKLTINEDSATNLAECIAGCRVELNAFESASLAIPNAPGFTLSCRLRGGDPGPDPLIFTYPRSKTFTNLLDLINTDHVFRETLSMELLDEDTTGDGIDEIKAVFTLVNNSTGASMNRNSNRIERRF
jgi:hypothetical protein